MVFKSYVSTQKSAMQQWQHQFQQQPHLRQQLMQQSATLGSFGPNTSSTSDDSNTAATFSQYNSKGVDQKAWVNTLTVINNNYAMNVPIEQHPNDQPHIPQEQQQKTQQFEQHQLLLLKQQQQKQHMQVNLIT